MNGVRARVLAEINNDALVELARGLAQFKSFSGQERECAEWLANYMDDAGMEVELQDVEPGRPNVIGRIRGDGTGASLMFNGHLDIDPVPQGYKHDPWKLDVREGKLWGHGLRNMKAGVASMVHAAVAVRRSGLRVTGDLVVAGVVGELTGGLGTRNLVERQQLTDLAIVPEPSNMNVRTVHASMFTALIKVRGVAGWLGGMHRYKTVNAVDKMADVIRALRDLEFSCTRDPALPGLPRFVISTIVGGIGEELLLWRTSYVPDTCLITLEVRMPPQMTVDTAIRDIDRALDAARTMDPELDVEVLPPPAAARDPWRASPLVMPALNLPVNHPLALAVVRHYRELLGRDPERVGAEDPGSYAGSDAGHLSEAGVQCLVFGPARSLWLESYVELEKLFSHARIMATCAAEILSTNREPWLQ
jgi:acetylornithine deacetylase